MTKTLFTTGLALTLGLALVGCSKENSLNKRLDGNWNIDKFEGKAIITNQFGTDSVDLGTDGGEVKFDATTGKGSFKLYTIFRYSGIPVRDTMDATITSWSNAEGVKVTMKTSVAGAAQLTWNWDVNVNQKEFQSWATSSNVSASVLGESASWRVTKFELTKKP